MNEFDFFQQIDQFFRALSAHDMRRCEQILVDLEDAAEEHAAVRPWRLYLNGILFAERDHDWASAERTYVTLLSEEAIEPQLQIRTLLALGIAHHYQGKWPEAIHAFTCSLPIAEAEGESISKIKALNEISATYQQGFIYGDYDKMALQDALDYGTQALKLLATLDSEQVNQLEGILLNNLGLIHKSLGNWDRAIQCYKRDLALSEIQDNRYGMGLSYGNLAEVWHEMGPDSWPLAQNAYQNALDLIREAGNLYEEIEALTNLATLYLDMDDSATAIEHFESAIALVESLRARTTSADSRTGFFSTVVKTYAGAVDAYLAADQPMDAFNVAERSRSRTLIEMLAEQPTRTTRHVPVSLLTEEQRIREHLRTLVNQSEPDKTDIAQLEEQWDDLQHKVQLVSAEYAAFQEFYPLTLQEIQRRLPSDTALIAYFTSATRIVAFVITYASFTVVPLALKPDVLGLAFDDQGYIHRLLPASDGRLLEPWALNRLYTFLVDPLLGELAPFKRLCIMPHGHLHYVPFHALSTSEHPDHCLIDDFEVSYAPSVTVLLDYCQRTRPAAKQSGLTIGFNGDDLQHAEREATAIARLVQGDALLENAATHDAVRTNTIEQQIIHFACHGRFNPARPLASYLALADGPLYVTDILHHFDLQASLVVLSACETGRSHVRRGDELIGFVRAFFYAGTPSVVVSLWPVDEISTRILMEFFYNELLAGRTKGDALRRAQRRLRQMTDDELVTILNRLGVVHPEQEINSLRKLTGSKQVFAHPYFWAPFFLVGETDSSVLPS